VGLEFIYSTIADLLLLENTEAVGLLMQVRALAKALGAEHVFWDGKLCDIPNTVKGASVATSRMGVRMFNVHASAGIEAVKAAVASKGNSLVLGVTVLTSIGKLADDTDECVSIFGDKAGNKVLHFARMLSEAGADGIICSPKELVDLSGSTAFDTLLKATPGVRPEWAAVGDQKRVMTPGEAIKAGADYLVIGRPITKPPAEIGGPVEAAKKIAVEIQEALIALDDGVAAD
jgi:orotidine-5'-phosphate decarboxylase